MRTPHLVLPTAAVLIAVALIAVALIACGGDSAATLEDLPATGSAAPSEQRADPAEATDGVRAGDAGGPAVDRSTGFVDPVCRMTVAEDARYRHTHDEVTYGFCSGRCLGRFAADPDAFLIALEE